MDAWHTLRQFTQARIAQGRAGCGMTTQALLDFQLAHAAARDAVLAQWDIEATEKSLELAGLHCLRLETQAVTRTAYLLNPQLGRELNQGSLERLSVAGVPKADVALILTNGLSSTAITEHALGLTLALTAALTEQGLTVSPVCLVPNGRVALSDEIGQRLGARVAVIVVGERPGLSAADSLGLYLTHDPRPGRTDADRNCLSNIRPPLGLSYQEAAGKLVYLIRKCLSLGYSGVNLKDDMGDENLTAGATETIADLSALKGSKRQLGGS